MTAARTIVDVHVLQTVPPSNLNRDDSGSPKSAIFGGVRRARVSSQSWKRAIRTQFREQIDPSRLGVRTKRLNERVARAIGEQAPDITEDDAFELAAAVLNAAGISTKEPRKPRTTASGRPIQEAEALAFLSVAQIEALAGHAVEASRDKSKPDKKTAVKLADTRHSIDIALFGRMVASNTELNTEAACQVAHALSTHAVANEFDYYTAVDEDKPEEESSGAGMLGVIEFNSATLYRYATVNVNHLEDNLDDRDVTLNALEAFVRAMITSMPTGKQNTFANRTLPDAAIILLRADQPLSLVGAFESAVTATNGRVAASARRLAEHAADIQATYGLPSVRSWIVASESAAGPLATLGARQPLADVIRELVDTARERLA